MISRSPVHTVCVVFSEAIDRSGQLSWSGVVVVLLVFLIRAHVLLFCADVLYFCLRFSVFFNAIDLPGTADEN